MSGFQWSTEVAQAAWIRERLSPFDSAVATSQVPAGYPAYARLLHPGQETAEDGSRLRLIRWSEVAARHGLPLQPGTHYQEIALLPAETPAAPWPQLQPPLDSLPAEQAHGLLDVLRAHTGTAQECWFCLWEGYFWIDEVLPDFLARVPRGTKDRSPADEAPTLELGPEDQAVPGVQFGTAYGWAPAPIRERRGPRVELPNREYVLYRGDLDEALAFMATEEQLPNLWWPADRSWCVATDLYGWWTYVAGSQELIAQLLGSEVLEAQPADPAEPQAIRLPQWLETAIDRAADEVIAGREGRVETSRGTVTARLRPPTADRPGELRTVHTGIDGSSGQGWGPVATADPVDLRSRVGNTLRSQFYENVI